MLYFRGNDYEAHTKCITEEERYSGKGFVSKEKKGEKKQNAWVEMLQSVLDEQKTAPRSVLRIIESISKHNNTPRKKPKFINFVKNVCGHKTNPKDIDQAWDLISVKLSELSSTNQNRNQKIDTSVSNGDEENKEADENETDLNGSTENEKGEKSSEDMNGENDNVENEENNEAGESTNVNKKLSKKQRKEEKKRQKYESELQSAEAPVPEEIEETQPSKKGKKKKSKNESSNGDINEDNDGKNNKNKKRKRQDTANSIPEIQENVTENIENVPIVKEKTQKKKLKIGEEEEADESICLHDQNVAKIEELSMQCDKFNWHAVIMSVLQKKGNELPFKRLQKKVLSEYSEATGRDVDDRIADKFIKKLRSAPNVRVDKNRVLLLD